MYRILTTALFLIFGTFVQGQSGEDPCFTLSFDDLIINAGEFVGEEYFESTGVRFFLENGTSPVLAEYGPPTEAFASNLGNDAPLPNQGLGQFFITDDGMINQQPNSTTSLIIELLFPADSISAFILDIDGDETYDMEFFDENDILLFDYTRESGDDLTGDALATEVGFRTNDCFSPIMKMRIFGFRGSPGFGMGMDNFTICPQGFNTLEDISLDISNITCLDNLGAIEIINNSSNSYEYSTDGGLTFNTQTLFEGLSLGSYDIVVLGEDGCSTIITGEVIADGPTIIENLQIIQPSCGLDNGSIIVTATQEQGVTYFLDVYNFQQQNEFTELPPGIYSISIIGPTGCSAAMDFELFPSQDLILEAIETEPDACEKTVGIIEVITSGGTGTINYSLDGLATQGLNTFDNLIAGNYLIHIEDEVGCTLDTFADITNTPGVLVTDLEWEETFCNLANGSIFINGAGGTGALEYFIGGSSSNSIGLFENLLEGDYDLMIVDDLGCFIDTLVSIPIPICPVFIPNIFTPYEQGANASFEIYTQLGQEVQILGYEIFDRWGSKVYEAYNFPIYEPGHWWTGSQDGIQLLAGVYAYAIEVQFYDGSTELYVGDITLVW